MRTEHTADRNLRGNAPFKYLSWQTVLTVLSLMIAVVSVVLAYLALMEPESAVTIEKLSDTNVFDIRRPLEDLDIVFRGQDVEERNLNLRIVTVNVVNSGGTSILPDHYDREDDWGVQFKDGEVVEARLIDTNSEYLRSKIVPRRTEEGIVAFPKVIFEKGASFVVEVLILHPKEKLPNIEAVGKIAGVNRIAVIDSPLPRSEASFGARLFQGSAQIHAVRALIYLVATVLFLLAGLLGGVGIAAVSESWTSRRRQREITITGAISNLESDETRQFLIDYYVSHGTDGLRSLQKLVNEPNRITWVRPGGRWIGSDYAEIDNLDEVQRLMHARRLLPGYRALMPKLESMGILQRDENDSPVIDAGFVQIVNGLATELQD